ncbi:hypothetical protein DSO57_1018259 [Entomophthora muscae]|uniref:Uncharacterized protein n=1 Tax=Entomophthora muscae TaxID=34485 RepID=A0ACC2U266_9FUNG|nr:hypothetical protein DSO57_1018259 [Entomophthora muscae]
MTLVVREALMEYLQDEYSSLDAPPPYTRFPDPKSERIVSPFPNIELAVRHLREASQAPLLSGLVASRVVNSRRYTFRQGRMRQVNFFEICTDRSMELMAKFSLISTTLSTPNHQQLGILLRTSSANDPVVRWILHCVTPHPISPVPSASTLIAVSQTQFRLTLLFRPEPIEFDWIRSEDTYELTRHLQPYPPIARLTLDTPRPQNPLLPATGRL